MATLFIDFSTNLVIPRNGSMLQAPSVSGIHRAVNYVSTLSAEHSDIMIHIT